MTWVATRDSLRRKIDLGPSLPTDYKASVSPPDVSPPAADSPDEASAEHCAANIGPAERRKRLTIGVLAMAVCTFASVLLIRDGAPRWWRLLLVLPWWTAALGIFQARAQICVAFAARGVRKLGSELEAQPPSELDAVRREARRIHLRALFTAVLLTALSMAWP